jgi:hypothetical protein
MCLVVEKLQQRKWFFFFLISFYFGDSPQPNSSFIGFVLDFYVLLLLGFMPVLLYVWLAIGECVLQWFLGLVRWVCITSLQNLLRVFVLAMKCDWRMCK